MHKGKTQRKIIRVGHLGAVHTPVTHSSKKEEMEMYQIAYYDKNSTVNGCVCDTFEEMLDKVSQLKGFRHIDILEFEKEEL